MCAGLTACARATRPPPRYPRCGTADLNNLNKPDTRFQQIGGTFGGPIIQNKLHFFGSLERVLNDRATTITIPARPEFNASPTTEDRVWNWIVRLDHQINANHSWNVRWLKELSPQRNQIVPEGVRQVTQAASREESDLDQTVAFSFNSSFGNTRFNTFRANFTQEDVAFANPNFNSNGGHGDQLMPTLQFLTFIDQQSNVMQARVNDAYQLDDTFSWFIPGKGGDHSLRMGVQYEYVDIFSTDQGSWNGTFSFSRSDAPFNSADPSTYPDRLQVRVPGPQEWTQKEQFFSAFAQDKWKLNNKLTLSLGVRYDLEKIQIPQNDNPSFSNPSDYPLDRNNIGPRVGFAYDWKGDGKTVLRGGYGRFYDKTRLELISAAINVGAFSNSFTVNFPTNNFDPGPSQGQLPTDPMLANGPTVNRTLLEQRFPPGSRLRNTGTVNFDNPDRVVPYTDQLSVGAERALTRDLSVGVDYVHAIGRDQLMTLELNPGVRASTVRTATVVRTDPRYVASVVTRANTGEIDYDALMFQLEKRYSNSHQFRVSYTWSKSRGNTAGVGVPLSNFQLLNDMHLEMNQGPTDVDRTHNFVFSGAAVIPRTGVTFSTIVRYLSGTAFTVHDSTTDPDRNGILVDPLPAGTYSGSGSDAITVESQGGRNGARGPSFFQADVRLGYRIKLGGVRTAELFGEVFNVTDRANFGNPTGDRFSTNFLRLTALRAGGIPRTAQFGARFGF